MRDLQKSYLLLLAAGLITSCSYRFFPTHCSEPLPGNLKKYAQLDPSLAESSGLIYLDGQLWTFNDSGGEAWLYAIDLESGSVIRKTIVSNAFNVDWEDIAMDEAHIYVADVGNNFGARDTLSIYRIPLSNLRSGDPSISHNGIISFSFDEIRSVTKAGYSSQDCEAIFAHGDSLYLFTKNWVDETTSVYVIPSKPGHFRPTCRYHYKTKVLITGADIFPEKKKVVLVGYKEIFPVVIRYGYDADPGRIVCGGKARIYPLRGGRQVEGICFDPAGQIYISSEKSIQMQTLYKLGISLH